MQNILNSLIGVGGLIVAGLSIYLNYKERIRYLRESLYNKQIEIIEKLWKDLINLNKNIHLLLNGNWDEFENIYYDFKNIYKSRFIFYQVMLTNLLIIL